MESHFPPQQEGPQSLLQQKARPVFVHAISGLPRNILVHESCGNPTIMQSRILQYGGNIASSYVEAHIILVNPTALSFYPRTYNNLNGPQVKSGEKVLVTFDWLEASIGQGYMAEFHLYSPIPPKRKYKKRRSAKEKEARESQDPEADPEANPEDSHLDPVIDPSLQSGTSLSTILDHPLPSGAAPPEEEEEPNVKVKPHRAPFHASDDARLVRFFAKYGEGGLDDQSRSVTAIARLLSEQYPEHTVESWRERYKRANGGPKYWKPLIEAMQATRNAEGYESPDTATVDVALSKKKGVKRKARAAPNDEQEEEEEPSSSRDAIPDIQIPDVTASAPACIVPLVSEEVLPVPTPTYENFMVAPQYSTMDPPSPDPTDTFRPPHAFLNPTYHLIQSRSPANEEEGDYGLQEDDGHSFAKRQRIV